MELFWSLPALIIFTSRWQHKNTKESELQIQKQGWSGSGNLQKRLLLVATAHAIHTLPPRACWVPSWKPANLNGVRCSACYSDLL